jgi:GGDEF domain-containing protein
MNKAPETAAPRDRQAFNKVYKSYRRVSRWSRVLTTIFWVLVAVVLLWLIPWLPFGLSTKDYSVDVTLAFALLGLCPAITAIVLLTKGMVNQRRDALAAWSTIHDGQTGLRNRDYFLERLKVQCQLGRELVEYCVGLILVKVEEMRGEGAGTGPPNEKTLRLLGMSIANQMRGSDLVAAIDETELGILVSASSSESLEMVSERIRRSLSREMDMARGNHGSRLMVEMGVGWEGKDADPYSLLSAARHSLKVVSIDGKLAGAA